MFRRRRKIWLVDAIRHTKIRGLCTRKAAPARRRAWGHDSNEDG